MVYELSPASLEMIDGFADEAEHLINGAVTEQWEATFANPKSPAYLGIPIKEGVNTALKKTGMPTLTAPRMVELDPAVNQYLEARGANYVTWLTDSGKKDLRGLLVKAYQENGTLQGFQKIFKEQYPQMQRWKATQIWVTESGLAANNAQLSAYEQIDDVIGFRTILGPNPCPICRFQHSYDHKLGQDPPLYHVFCACLTEPIIKGVHKFREDRGDPTQFMDDKVYKRLNSSYKDFRKESIIKIDLSAIMRTPAPKIGPGGRTTPFHPVTHADLLERDLGWVQQWSDTEAEAVRHYKTMQGCEDINAYCRTGKAVSKEDVARTEVLDSLLNGHTLPDLNVYRGGNLAHLGGSVDNLDDLTGTIHTYKGFTSTATDKELAKEFIKETRSKGETAYIAKIKVPSGSKGGYIDAGLYTEEMEFDEYSDIAYMMTEVLLPRNTVLRVAKATPIGPNLVELEMELL